MLEAFFIALLILAFAAVTGFMALTVKKLFEGQR
ncbi:hypothetical protein CUT44_12470 [Streptomyces carminius]|uniref:Uncharacterized protein n=1 Tax=Streptomyces carminius TaxID=2665496 RepID=A0A2M8LZX5_9ACTN|nr:hypothetical protein CUT44_12470 [Streptomyces carminius]